MITASLVLAVIAVVLAVYVLAVMNAVAHAQSHVDAVQRAELERRAATQRQEDEEWR